MKSALRICLLTSALALGTAPLVVQAQTAASKAAPKAAAPAAAPAAGAKAAVRATPAVHSTAPSWMAKPVVAAGFKVPRLSDGHPDLGGAWSNVSMAQTARAVNNPMGQPYGDR